MTRLRQRELATFSKVLEGLYADTNSATLSERMLAALQSLVSCDFATYTLMDLRQRRFLNFSISAGISSWPGLDTLQNFFHEDPAANHLRRTRTSQAVKVSDFVSLRQYRSLGIFREVFGPTGCDRRMGFAVQGKLPADVTATLNRQRRDFSEEERTLLNLLRPHLLLANAQAHAQKQARLERERERTRLGDVFGAGLAELDERAQVLWSTPRAETLLAEFFPNRRPTGASEELPGELRTRLLSVLPTEGRVVLADASLKPWRPVWQFAGPDHRTLKVRLVPGELPQRWYLVIKETSAAPPAQQLVRALRLTGREGEVLHWLRQGKTNWEMSIILGNTEKTVGKHLENIFRKLNVENRTAAVQAAMEASADL